MPGVTETMVGYTQGHDGSPSYEAVCSGRTGHTEAVQVCVPPSPLTQWYSRVACVGSSYLHNTVCMLLLSADCGLYARAVNLLSH